jgi:hypothetical protein
MKRMKVGGGLSMLLIAAALLVGAPAAMAQLPGGSAVDQYTENVPGAGGDQPGGGTNGGSDGTSDGSAAPGTDPSATGGSPSSASPSDLSEGGAGSSGAGQDSGAANASGAGSSRGGVAAQGDVPATLTSQPVPADRPGDGGGVSPGWPLALGVVLLSCAGIYWYRRRYPETLIDRRPRQAPQRLMG